MTSHQPPFVPITASLTCGVKRPPGEPCSDLEAPQTSHARPWLSSPRTPKTSPPPARRHTSPSRDRAAQSGDSSADSAGGGGGGGSSTLVDPDAPAAMVRSSVRLRAEDAGPPCAVPAKRLRAYDDDCRHEVDGMPAAKRPCCDPSSSSSPWTSSSVCASPSRLPHGRWPRTSPLGPKTTTYCRKSRTFPQPGRGPSKDNPTLSWRCLLQNLQSDNMARNPYDQSAQWCQDLGDAGLKDIFHPQYWCNHLYHPSDPGYDEEWPDESWSDEEWSDSEDPLTSSDEDPVDAQAEAAAASQVRIVTHDEPSQAGSGSSTTFTFVHWGSLGSPLSSKATVFHSQLSWDDPPDSNSVGSEENGRHGGEFSEPADMVAAA